MGILDDLPKVTSVSDDRNLSSLLTIRAGASATPTTYYYVRLQNVSDGTRQGKFSPPLAALDVKAKICLGLPDRGYRIAGSFWSWTRINKSKCK